MATHAGHLLSPTYSVPEEEHALPSERESFAQLLARLSRQSVVKHFDAYADIDWDSEEFRIDPSDPHWELGPEDALGATAWYQALPQPTRARLGLHMMATTMKVGTQFENVLTRGLLEFALTLPNGAPEFRYVYHEAIEEGQHTLMFQEFVNRTGFDIPGLPPLMRFGSRQVVRFGRTFPELFLVFVLGGEDPIDHVQRTALHGGRAVHPLLRRIMQIHVTEEARHLCFARQYLKEHVPRLGRLRRLALTVRAPIILAIMARLMLQPSRQIIREYHIPAAVIREAYTDNPRHRAGLLAALAKVRALCQELGIASVKLWRSLGIWEEALTG
jgi:hypothetical protein